ncbi:MAG: hypothetical protein K5892_04090, partial [Acholeplasmatales bacterium]|nr:hypothetical protein [Acholeplasmatales bacterium]
MKKKIFGSLLLNIFTMLSVIVCTIIIAVKSPQSFKMFTTQSNIICGIVATIIVIFDILILLKKKDEIPTWLRTAKMVVTTGVTLTFLVVVFYLGFVAIAEGYSYFIMFNDTNICFHLLTPISAIISFILFEGSKDIKFKLTFLNMIHMSIYTIFYSINVFTHLNEDGSVNRKYDWYYFVQGDN